METETVTFKVGLDGASVAPGDIIQTSDEVRSGERLGGRLLAASTTALTLDAPVTIEEDIIHNLVFFRMELLKVEKYLLFLQPLLRCQYLNHLATLLNCIQYGLLDQPVSILKHGALSILRKVQKTMPR